MMSLSTPKISYLFVHSRQRPAKKMFKQRNKHFVGILAISSIERTEDTALTLIGRLFPTNIVLLFKIR